MLLQYLISLFPRPKVDLDLIILKQGRSSADPFFFLADPDLTLCGSDHLCPAHEQSITKC